VTSTRTEQQVTPTLRVSPGPLVPVGSQIVLGDGSPALGVRRGLPELFDYSRLPERMRPGRVASLLRHKKWISVFVATDDVLLTAAVMQGGAAGTFAVCVADRATGQILADANRPGAAVPLVAVGDRPGEGHRSRYRLPGTDVSVVGEQGGLRFRAVLHRAGRVPMFVRPWVELDVVLAMSDHDAITAVAQLPDQGLVSATAKNSGLRVDGAVTIRDRSLTQQFPLHGIGGYDYTNGHMPRHTRWRRLFAAGELPDGRPLGFNVTAGFTGREDAAHENVGWLGDQVSKLPPSVMIESGNDRNGGGGPWRIVSPDGRVDLVFQPVAEHIAAANWGVVRGRLVQPMGHITGYVELDGERVDVDAVPALAEDQDVYW
jgi:hypothetical protein